MGFSEKVTCEQRLAGGEGATQGWGVPGGGNSQCKGPAARLRSSQQVRGTMVDRGRHPPCHRYVRQRKLSGFKGRVSSHPAGERWGRTQGPDSGPRAASRHDKRVHQKVALPVPWYPQCLPPAAESKKGVCVPFLLPDPLQPGDRSWRPHYFSLSCPQSSQLDPECLQSP